MEAEGEVGRGQASVAGDDGVETLLGESRWPPVVSVLVFLALNVAVRVWLPGNEAIRVPWLLPAIEVVLLVVLLTHDLTGADDRRRLHRVALVLVGAVARISQQVPVDFAFTQQLSPEVAPPGWRPVFLDYLHLGFTNATAFSPSDVVPLTRRAKYAMLLQSTVALALFGLVVARAVNAFK